LNDPDAGAKPAKTTIVSPGQSRKIRITLYFTGFTQAAPSAQSGAAHACIWKYFNTIILICEPHESLRASRIGQNDLPRPDWAAPIALHVRSMKLEKSGT
jgi:hypothetical protein